MAGFSGSSVSSSSTSSSAGGLTTNVVTGTTQTLAVDNEYVANNTSLVTFTLPSTAAVGKKFRVTGLGSGGWKIAQNAGQIIRVGNKTSASGASGYISSVHYTDCVEIECLVANTTFQAYPLQGNIYVQES